MPAGSVSFFSVDLYVGHQFWTHFHPSKQGVYLYVNRPICEYIRYVFQNTMSKGRAVQILTRK